MATATISSLLVGGTVIKHGQLKPALAPAGPISEGNGATGWKQLIQPFNVPLGFDALFGTFLILDMRLSGFVDGTDFVCGFKSIFKKCFKRNWLNDKKQKVRINGQLSQLKELCSGVPQGMVLDQYYLFCSYMKWN